jgi:predicted enzyme related to lactoylglutathione lyase
MATRPSSKAKPKTGQGKKAPSGRTNGARANGARKAAAGSKPSAAQVMVTRKVRPGAFISHTELASSDPAATKKWAEQALGWKFLEPMPTPQGPYHMWSFGDNMGGGIRANNPPETPGSIPYVEVPDIQKAYDRAVKAGATPMMPPEDIPGGMGSIAIVQAPGGPAIGLWGPPK